MTAEGATVFCLSAHVRHSAEGREILNLKGTRNNILRRIASQARMDFRLYYFALAGGCMSCCILKCNCTVRTNSVVSSAAGWKI